VWIFGEVVLFPKVGSFFGILPDLTVRKITDFLNIIIPRKRFKQRAGIMFLKMRF
jgi:hypothetical protein